jgi:heme-degrading monooxygenase HmoA
LCITFCPAHRFRPPHRQERTARAFPDIAAACDQLHRLSGSRLRDGCRAERAYHPSYQTLLGVVNAMIAVIFEAEAQGDQQQAYLDAAALLRPHLEKMPGFISIERFVSLTNPGKLLSLSFWQDEESVRQWRNLEAHRSVQAAGRERIFADYRLRVAAVLRDYGMTDRGQAPQDSRLAHG